MFDSGIKATDLIAQIKEEADIAIPISDDSYMQWLNSVEQLLYSEVIKEQKKNRLDLTRSLIDLIETNPGLKLNIWPLFNSQKIGNVALNVSEDGTYTVLVDARHGMPDTGAFFTKKVNLRRGTYALCDNASEFPGGESLTSVKRVFVKNAATGAELAGISYAAPSNWETSFTLNADTEVILGITIVDGINYPTDGFVLRPQLEFGSTKSAEFLPPVRYALTDDIPVIVCSLPTNNAEAPVRFEDIQAVYADNTQMIKSTLASGPIFPDTYFKDENKLGLHFSRIPNDLTVVYTVRPELKEEDNLKDAHVMVPAEFIDLVKAKLRGEAYKLANEGELAAVWLNDYNVLLETFKVWVSEKQSKFGL